MSTPTTLTAKVQWSKGRSARDAGRLETDRAIPTGLKIGGTYLIFAEVDYTYMPTVGYVMSSAASPEGPAYTRPRHRPA